MAQTHLRTFDDVVAALGGVTECARITGRTPPNVCKWRKSYRRFPARVYLLLQDALAERGFTVPHSLFQFDHPADVARRLSKPRRRTSRSLASSLPPAA